MPPVKELKIDRKLWGQRALLNLDGTMCCLGHLSVACGVPKEQLRFNETGYDGDVLTVFSRQIGLPREDWVEDFGLPDWAGDNESTLGHSATRAAEINDDESLLRAGREKLLVDLFAMNGITLSFFN